MTTSEHTKERSRLGAAAMHNAYVRLRYLHEDEFNELYLEEARKRGVNPVKFIRAMKGIAKGSRDWNVAS